MIRLLQSRLPDTSIKDAPADRHSHRKADQIKHHGSHAVILQQLDAAVPIQTGDGFIRDVQMVFDTVCVDQETAAAAVPIKSTDLSDLSV